MLLRAKTRDMLKYSSQVQIWLMGKFFVISHNKQTTFPGIISFFLTTTNSPPHPHDMSNRPKQRQQQVLPTSKTSQRQGDDNNSHRQGLEAQCGASSPWYVFIPLFKDYY
jgi:hypothetical protein